jgi:hypothetical protein
MIIFTNTSLVAGVSSTAHVTWIGIRTLGSLRRHLVIVTQDPIYLKHYFPFNGLHILKLYKIRRDLN